MALYRDEVVRVSIAQLRAQFMPRVFRALRSVELSHDGCSATAAIEIHGAPSCPGGARRWLKCPSCGRRASVLGVVDGAWRCPRCGGWRSRNRRATRHASASGA